MIEKFLMDLGFSKKEVDIYLKLQSVNDATVTELSRITAINRTTLYPILEHLVKKGLVLEIEKGKKARFQAEPPERLATYIQNEKTKLEEQEKLLDEVIPRLKSVTMQSGENPIVKVMEGREGILKSVTDYFEAGDTEEVAYLIYPYEKITNLFSKKELEAARKLRLDKKIKAVGIYTGPKQEQQGNQATIHWIDGDKYTVSCEIGIYEDRVRIHTFTKNLSAIYIKNKDVADTLRTLFELALKGIEKE